MLAGMGTLGTRPGFPVAGDGFWAQMRSGDEHLRLFAEVYFLGYLAVVFDVNRKTKLPGQDANNLDEAKKKAEGIPAGYLHYRGSGALPKIEWQLNQQSKSSL
jgi:hypothetical protein